VDGVTTSLAVPGAGCVQCEGKRPHEVATSVHAKSRSIMECKVSKRKLYQYNIVRIISSSPDSSLSIHIQFLAAELVNHPSARVQLRPHNSSISSELEVTTGGPSPAPQFITSCAAVLSSLSCFELKMRDD